VIYVNEYYIHSGGLLPLWENVSSRGIHIEDTGMKLVGIKNGRYDSNPLIIADAIALRKNHSIMRIDILK
jgi:hypothetical protein